MESMCCISQTSFGLLIGIMLNTYMERKKEIIYNDKTLNDPQDLCTEADIPHKLPISYSLGLRYYPVLIQVWTGFRDYYSQATQIKHNASILNLTWKGYLSELSPHFYYISYCHVTSYRITQIKIKKLIEHERRTKEIHYLIQYLMMQWIQLFNRDSQTTWLGQINLLCQAIFSHGHS